MKPFICLGPPVLVLVVLMLATACIYLVMLEQMTSVVAVPIPANYPSTYADYTPRPHGITRKKVPMIMPQDPDDEKDGDEDDAENDGNYHDDEGDYNIPGPHPDVKDLYEGKYARRVNFTPFKTWYFKEEEELIAMKAYSDVEITYIAAVICTFMFSEFKKEAKLFPKMHQQKRQQQQPQDIFPPPGRKSVDDFSWAKSTEQTSGVGNLPEVTESTSTETITGAEPRSEVVFQNVALKSKSMSEQQKMLLITSCVSSVHLLFQLTTTVLLTCSWWQKAIFGSDLTSPANERSPPGAIEGGKHAEQLEMSNFGVVGSEVAAMPSSSSAIVSATVESAV